MSEGREQYEAYLFKEWVKERFPPVLGITVDLYKLFDIGLPAVIDRLDSMGAPLRISHNVLPDDYAPLFSCSGSGVECTGPLVNVNERPIATSTK